MSRGLRNHTRPPRFVHDLAVLAGGQLVTKLIGLVVFAALARTLDPSGYGAVEYVVAFAGFAAMAIDCGLGIVGVRRYSSAPSIVSTLAADIPLGRLAVAIVVVPLLVVGTLWLGPPSTPAALVLCFAASLLLSTVNQEWLLQATQRMPDVALAQGLRMAVFAAVALVMVRTPGDVVLVGAAELAAATVAAAYYLAIQHLRVTPLRFDCSLPRALDLAREGVSLGASQLVWSATQVVPLMVLGSLGTGIAVAWFAAAYRIVGSLATFSYVYHFNLYPVLARRAASNPESYARLLQASFRVTAWAGIGFALAVSLLASPILATIFGARFAAAGATLATLIWVIPITFLSGHARWSLVVAGAHREILRAQVVGFIATVLLGLPLAAYLEQLGAACAAVAGSLAFWIEAARSVARRGAMPPTLATLLAPVLVALATGAAAAYFGSGWIAVGCAIALYVALAPVLDRRLIAAAVALARAKAADSGAEPPMSP